MYDRDLVLEILTQIHDATLTVIKRFTPIKSVDDLTGSFEGREKLDALCMQLIAIGESLKKIDTMTGGELLSKYPRINWKGAKGMRDVISHHYFDIDAEEIYFVCTKDIPLLAETVKTIIEDLKNNS
jgi:uncharacterized protein with HEPN domain